MGSVTGFIDVRRSKPAMRPIAERVRDWNEIYLRAPEEHTREQGSRCMDCGIPFCHQGCPLGNRIPDWNDLAYRGQWRGANDRLHATNCFPEFTARVCPAPCEASCVLSIAGEAVTIKQVELEIVERAFAEGWVTARLPEVRSGKRVAVVGSGPAGLAAADQLNRDGHVVTVFERSDRIGGLLRYGIPEFKLEKRVLNRRLAIMAQSGITFRTDTEIGVDLETADLRRGFDAIVLCCGAPRPRDLLVPGRDLKGIHFALEYLAQQNRRCEGDDLSAGDDMTAKGKHVVIIGGGDTGADCLGTAHRQGARSVLQLELMPRPPEIRAADNPWPQWPNVFRTSSAQEEGGDRRYSVSTERFIADGGGRVKAIEAIEVETVREVSGVTFARKPGTEVELEADLVLLALGFAGADRSKLVSDLGVRMTDRGTVWHDGEWMTSEAGVFTAGDMQRGQSLVVWAIADGLSAARSVDTYLKRS